MAWTLPDFPHLKLPSWLQQVPEYDSEDHPRFRHTFEDADVVLWVYVVEGSDGRPHYTVQLDYYDCEGAGEEEITLYDGVQSRAASQAFADGQALVEEHGCRPPPLARKRNPGGALLKGLAVAAGAVAVGYGAKKAYDHFT